MEVEDIKNKYVYVCDLESESEQFYIKYGYTKTWACYAENLNDEHNNVKTICLKDFINIFISKVKKTKETHFLYWHNLSFDGTFILYAIKDMNILHNTSVLINKQKKIFNIKIEVSRKKYVDFRCSFLILPFAVSKLPYSTKTIIDYDKIRNYKKWSDLKEDEENYLYQDVKTVKKNLVNASTIMKLDLSSRTFQTMASISYKSLIKGVDRELLPLLSHDDDVFMRQAYIGGYVKVNPRYKARKLGKITSYDIKSSYPHKMKECVLPFGKLQYVDKIPQNRLFIIELFIHKAIIKEGHHPFLSESRSFRILSGKDIYPDELNNVRLVLSSVDYELMKKYYNVKYTHGIIITFEKELKGVFDEHIDKYFQMKDDASKILDEYDELVKQGHTLTEKDDERIKIATFEKMYAKLMINSPYGKFGTNPLMKGKEIEVDEHDELIFYDVEDLKECKYYLPIAIFITACGRQQLIECIQENKERFIYCDTDSVKAIGHEPLKMPNGYHIGKELGYWELEDNYKRACFLKSKQYIVEKQNGKIERAIGGLNRDNHHMVNFDNIEIGLELEKAKKQSKLVKGGRIIIEINYRL